MIGLRFASAAAIAIAIMGGSAVAQAPEERVFSFHSNATSSCPGLDWHLVVAPNYTVSGMVGWQNMQMIARVTGTMNPQNKTFQLSAKEQGGNRTATITGNVIEPGHINASIKGPGVNCQNLDIWAWTPSQKGPGGAGRS